MAVQRERNKNKFKEHFNYKTVERVRELTIIKVFVLIAFVFFPLDFFFRQLSARLETIWCVHVVM
jgi:hypothetical protein